VGGLFVALELAGIGRGRGRLGHDETTLIIITT
jgi:hypothetical protein